MKSYIIDREVTITRAEYMANPGGVHRMPPGTAFTILRDDGTPVVRQENHRIEEYASPDDDEAELHWAVCLGVIALGEWAARQHAKHAARAFVATQPGYECVCCAGTGIRPASGRYAVTCECGAEHPIPRILDALIAKHMAESEDP